MHFSNKIIKLIVVSLKGKSGFPIGENASCFSKKYKQLAARDVTLKDELLSPCLFVFQYSRNISW